MNWQLDGFSLDPENRSARYTFTHRDPSGVQSPELAAAVRKCVDDPDARVRFQAAIVLGELADDDSTAALVAIAKRDAADPWTRLAVLSSAADRSHRLGQVLTDVLRRSRTASLVERPVVCHPSANYPPPRFGRQIEVN